MSTERDKLIYYEGLNEELLEAAEEGNEELVKILLKEGANVDAHHKNGTTALMLACWRRKSQIVKILILAGADINYYNIDGETAMSIGNSHMKQVIRNAIKEREIKEIMFILSRKGLTIPYINQLIYRYL